MTISEHRQLKYIVVEVVPHNGLYNTSKIIRKLIRGEYNVGISPGSRDKKFVVYESGLIMPYVENGYRPENDHDDPVCIVRSDDLGHYSIYFEAGKFDLL